MAQTIPGSLKQFSLRSVLPRPFILDITTQPVFNPTPGGVYCSVSDGEASTSAFFPHATATDLSHGSRISVTDATTAGSFIVISAYTKVAAIPKPSIPSSSRSNLPIVTKHEAPSQGFHPIGSLTNFTKGKPTILARVTSLGQVRTWTNVRGSGKLLSFTVTDADGDEIRLTGFGENLVTKLEQIIEEGRVYTFSNFAIKVADPKFNSTSHQYELTLKDESMIKEFHGPEARRISSVSGNFINLSEVSEKNANDMVDILAVLKHKEVPNTVTSQKLNRDLIKMDCIIADNSMGGSEMALTVWGKNVDVMNQIAVGSVIAIKNSKVTVYRDKKGISTVGTTRITNDCNQIDGVRDLERWAITGLGATRNLSESTGDGFKPTGDFESTTTERMTLEQASAALPPLGQAQFANALGWVIDVKPLGKEQDGPIWYDACSVCKKKVDGEAGQYTRFCVKCNDQREVVPRFMTRVQLQDDSGTVYTTAFDEVMERILGNSAAHMAELKMNNPDAYENALEAVKFRPFMCKLKLQTDNYNNENRLRVNILNVDKPNFAAESWRILRNVITPAIAHQEE
ncbi:hypothetical protein RCL1_000752 [Eukaryota sp. TZLM3-RCL]